MKEEFSKFLTEKNIVCRKTLKFREASKEPYEPFIWVPNNFLGLPFRTRLLFLMNISWVREFAKPFRRAAPGRAGEYAKKMTGT